MSLEVICVDCVSSRFSNRAHPTRESAQSFCEDTTANQRKCRRRGSISSSTVAASIREATVIKKTIRKDGRVSDRSLIS